MESHKTKLTLSCDKSIIEDAKKYAELNDDSISHIVSEFLETYIKINKHKNSQDSAIGEKIKLAKKYSGAFSLGESRDYKSEFYESRITPKSKE